MNILEKIKNKSTIDIDSLLDRLKKELNIKNKYSEQLQYALLDTLNIILNHTHLNKVEDELYTLLYRMTKDYWFLNKYDKLIKEKDLDKNNSVEEQSSIKSITVGDTTTTFYDETSKVEINGVKYDAGTIDFSEDAFVEKYKRELYKHRVMRW